MRAVLNVGSDSHNIYTRAPNLPSSERRFNVYESIKTNIVNPLITRVGTLAAGGLAHYGITDASVLGEQLAVGAGAVVLVILEAFLRNLWARR